MLIIAFFLVSSQIAPHCKTMFAIVTLEWLFARMTNLVSNDIMPIRTFIITDCAFHKLFRVVRDMSLENNCLLKLTLTNIACKSKSRSVHSPFFFPSFFLTAIFAALGFFFRS